MKILLVEDDLALAMGTEYSLTEEGMHVYSASSLEEAKRFFLEEEGDFSCVLLDIMLADKSGYDLCQWIKERNPKLPVIFLSALSDEGNIVRGLNIGGDDYVTKPFRIKELVARIYANTRKAERTQILSGAEPCDLRMEPEYAVAWKGETRIDLTPSEYRLLEVLVQHRGQVLTREQLMERIWSVEDAYVDDNTLSVYVRRLREKLDQNGAESCIKTVRGIGYTYIGIEKKE